MVAFLDYPTTCANAEDTCHKVMETYANVGEPAAGSTAYSDAKDARATSNGGRKIMSGHNLSMERLVLELTFQKFLNSTSVTHSISE